MPTKTRDLVLIGDSAFAEVAYEYFEVESSYRVVAFAVERAYRQRDSLFALPVVDLEDLPARFAPQDHAFFAALVYTQKNALRSRLYAKAKSFGYTPASFISPRATVWRNATIGEHCFIFEGNVVQPFAQIGDDVVLWSGNHIGHHSAIGDHTFVSSHVVVSGFVTVGRACFLGVNSTISNNTKVGDRCVLGAGALVLDDVPDDQTVVGLWKARRP